MMAFSKLLLNTQNSSRPLKTRPAVSAQGTMAPINKVVSLQSSPRLPQVIPAAAAKASNHFPPTPRPLEGHICIGQKVNPGGNARGYCLLLLVCLITGSSPASVSFHMTSRCVLLGCSAGNARKGSMQLRIRPRACEKDNPQVHARCVQDAKVGHKSLSEKNYFLEKTNKTPLVAMKNTSLDTTWAPAPALSVLLLLLLSHFSHVRLRVTPWTAAHQASPSLGFSRQEHWSGLPFPSPMHESGK